jgi:hypothetical protein
MPRRKKKLIEEAYLLGERQGLIVCNEDEAGMKMKPVRSRASRSPVPVGSHRSRRLASPMNTSGRYAIENYLLEPTAVAEEVRMLSNEEPTAADIETYILQVCRDLASMMAANWVFTEAGTGRFFREGHDLVERTLVVNRVATEIGCSTVQADEKITIKEGLIAPLLPTLETAYLRINGKHILFHVHKKYIQKELTQENLRKYLARTIKDRIGIPEDIKLIVEQRVLA